MFIVTHRRLVRALAASGIALGSYSNAAVLTAQTPDRVIIVIPDVRKPDRPRGALPPSCRPFLTPLRSAHWEVQATQLAHEDTVRGSIARVVDARATVLARPGLAAVSLRAFADTGQAVARFDLSQPHNGLAAGSYCLVARYDPRIEALGGEFDRRRWQMFLYDLKAPGQPAAAWVPFISRLDWRADLVQHPRVSSAPYPPVHFQFLVDSDFPTGTSRSTVGPTLNAPSNFLAMAVWARCVAGCCTGGVEALQPYQ